jgi:hypothetical protein
MTVVYVEERRNSIQEMRHDQNPLETAASFAQPIKYGKIPFTRI